MLKWLGGIGLGIGLSMISCSNLSSSSDELPDSTPILIINAEEITLEQFKKKLKAYKKKYHVSTKIVINPSELTWLKNRVLEEIIWNSLLRQEVRKKGIEISQKELDEAIQKSKLGYSEDSFEKQLAFEGLTNEDWKYSIKNSMLINKLMENLTNNKVFPSDSEMLNYFEANESKFYKKKQVKALQIMVETEEEIRKIQKDLLSKQKDFSVLAKEFSLGPEGVNGGDLGYFEAGLMPEEFDNVFKLKINDVSEIIRTPYGFHLFKVVDKVKERKMSFDESKNRIEKLFLEKLQSSAYQSWLIQLKKNAVIEIKNEIFEKIKSN